jgi:hypothetical protein
MQEINPNPQGQNIKIGLMLGAVCCTLFILYSSTMGGYSLSYFIVSIPIVACSISITAAFYFMLKESKYLHLTLLAAGLIIAALQS